MTTMKTRAPLMTITHDAARRLNDLTAERDNAGLLRVGIKKGGCAGMEYTMSWTDVPDRFDEVVEDNGAKVLIEPTAVMFLLGTSMDYQKDKLSAGFVFNNPNQTSACGCGESVELAPASKDKLRELEG